MYRINENVLNLMNQYYIIFIIIYSNIKVNYALYFYFVLFSDIT